MKHFDRPRITAAPLRPIGCREVHSTRPQIVRTIALFCLFCAALLIGGLSGPARAQTAPVDEAKFRAFISALWPDAQRQGVSRATFEAAFAGMKPDASILQVTKKQAEFVKPIWHYVNASVSEQRISRGKSRAQEFAQTLERIEARYGVDRYIVLAVWGMETSYGGFIGKSNVIRSLATLAASGYRGDFFRDELLIALKILQEGHVEPEGMIGSWAGAMGQTQFMPSSFMKHAVDWDGDRHKNIWTSVPDALASTANYLAQHGWIKGWTWGYEVALPQGFSLAGYDPQDYRPFTHWTRQGVARADGDVMPHQGEAALFLPAGKNGPAFLVTRNFQTIKSYNTSTSYALGIALLSDRLAGAGGLRAQWPVKERTLDARQSLEMQKQLVRFGYNIGELDGKIGEKVQGAIRQYQRKAGLTPDGFATVSLLEQMRARR
ncbi:MAG: lytic murein transglycosylase [Beijerinckiaceae bacterium]|nr:lytic murein transglycosylase [Beijerinckiaceae bacterium]MDO9439478.1 lytic murein transglycosylase [Beijerinckiaceae bacterium]